VTAATRKSSALIDTRVIYCGDNLDQLRKLPEGCVDLIYIDPPFNSNRNYEVFWGETKEKRSFADRHESTKAYIEYMRPRCAELHRVLKKTGSFYYHCDWHASHYVKVMLDQIFGENQFQAELVWKRTSAHGDTRGYGHITDSIFFYSVSADFAWNRQIRPYEKDYVEKFYRSIDSASGKRFMLDNLTGAGTRKGETGQVWRGVDVTKKGRHWIRPPSELDKWDLAGLIYWPPKGGTPRFKRFLNEEGGLPLDNIWTDIPAIGAHSLERLGYPTQKPLALLERVIKASSDENDIVLDAFCGCGTALVAAQKLKRQWIGIDISPTACRVMAQRLKKDCGLKEDEKLQQIGRGFVVRDLPKTEAELRKYPPFEFENWAVVALGGTKNARQTGDMGIDGRIYPVSAMPERRGARTGEMDFMDEWYPIQVKQTAKVGRPDIDAFEAVMMREERMLGYFVGFEFTSDALFEIDRFRRKEGREIKPLTVREILDEEIRVIDNATG
jgi:site-specific DNA-methyltransferase (adenine-specific)